VSESLEDLRVDLAAALRWAARMDFSEGICNHFSVVVPDAERGERFLINPQGWHWSEITASALVLCDAEGTVLQGDNEVEATAFHIHSRVHLKAPHAKAVLHTHMPYATALCCLEGGRLEMAEQNALRFYERIAYDDDYNGVALDNDEGERIAHKLGNRDVLFLASHGVVVGGPSVAEAFDTLYYLERACMFQVLARSTGGTLRQIPDAMAAHARAQIDRIGPPQAVAHFAALKRILDREEPEYRH
jgi:ribulose-5-phosphate 4-epimerase/fuculose-1-phosphate aldolase